MARAKPAALKKIDGNPGGHKIRPEVSSRPLDTEPPKGCSAAFRKEWEYIVASCPPGVFSSLDRKALIHYCESSVAYDEAKAAWDESGREFAYYSDKGLGKPDPHYRAFLDAGAALMRVCNALGFTPTSRGKILKAETDGDKKENPFASFQS